MDCQQLQEDIRELKALRDTLGALYKESIKSGRGKVALFSVYNETIKSADEKLEKYLPKFIEEYPDIFTFRISEKIEGFKDINGRPADINFMFQLGDNEALIGGAGGTLSYACRDEAGHWQLDYMIKVDNEKSILSISSLPDGSILAGGTKGYIVHIDKNEDGQWVADYNLDTFRAADNSKVVISILPLPDDGALIGGGSETLYYASKGPDNRWKLDYMIEGAAFGELQNISTISLLPDESVLAGSSLRGTFYHLIKDKDKKWIIDDSFQNIPLGVPYHKTIVSIFSLSDGSVIALEENGLLLNIVKNTDNQWRIDNKIRLSMDRIHDAVLLPDGSIMITSVEDIVRYVKDSKGHWKQADCLMANNRGLWGCKLLSLKDGGLLAGGWNGALYSIEKPKKDLETLKNNLDKIVDTSIIAKFPSKDSLFE